MTVTTDAFVEHAFPIAVQRGQPGEVELVGWNLPEAARKVRIPAGEGADANVFHPRAANTALVRLEPHATVVKAKTTDGKEPQTLALPTTVSGMLEAPKTPDRYQFVAKKGQKMVFQLESRALGFALSGVLRLTDAGGKVLARAEEPPPQPTGTRDAVLTFTVPQDGTYHSEVADLHGEAGPRHVYCLRALLARPDYRLTLAADRFTIAPGKPLEIVVAVERRAAFAGEIEITAEGLPKGVTATSVKVKAGDKTATLRFTAASDALAGSVRIAGRVEGDAELTRTATSTPAPLKGATPHVWLTVSKPAK